MPTISSNPFPGLRSFDYEENHLFFGREQHISDLLHKLKLHHFVAIVGTSGSGKSSLVRAGLLPAIHNGRMNEPDKKWLIATMKPGNQPIKNLVDSLLHKSVFSTGDQIKDQASYQRMDQLLRASSLGLVQAVRGLLQENTQLLILLDQFEEIFRFSSEGVEKNDAESEQFVNLIVDAIRQRDVPIYVVLTIRSDFLGDCVRFLGLPEAINDGHYLVPRMNERQNRLVITGPVQHANGKISPRLVQQVTNDLGDNPDQLPVLQHALMRTWDKWIETAEAGEPMDIRHYEMTGTMKNALSNHADEAYHELKDEHQKKLIEIILKCLTVKSGENRGVRRPTSIKNLMQITGTSFDELKEVLHPFRKSGRTFILPSEEHPVSESTVLDISHESLMRGWDRLKLWVNEETESTEIYNRLCSGALLHKAGKAALWRDPELQVAIDWKEKYNPNSAWAKQYNSHYDAAMHFLEESKKERSNEMKSKRKRTLIIRAAVITFLIVVSSLSVWALYQTKQATEKSILAEQQTMEAINQKQLAEKAKDMALEASKQAMDAKSYAELQANIAGEQKLLAENQKKVAEEQKSKAESEAQRASAEQQEALRQKQIAEEKRLEALNQKQKADSSQTEANRLRLLSISQAIAFKSLQQKEDNQLAALLAYQAYKFANENNGNLNDNQLYNALYSSAQKIDNSFKTTVVREFSSIQNIIATSNGLKILQDNGTIKSFSRTNYTESNPVKLTKLPSNLNTYYLNESPLMAAYGTDNNEVVVYDLQNPSQPQMLTGHTGLVRSVAFYDNMIATGGRDSNLILWKNQSIHKKIRFNSRLKSIDINRNTANLYIGCEDGSVWLCNTTTGDKKNFSSNAGARVQVVKCAGNGKLIATGFSNGTVQVMNANGQLQRTLNEPASVDHISLDEKNDLLITAMANKIIHIYHLSDLSQKPIELSVNSNIVSIDSYNGEFVYVACADKTVRAYPVKTSYFEKILQPNIKRSLSAEEWNAFIGEDVRRN